MEKRYIQLYSLKDVINDDFAGTLRRVKELGYTGVEFAGGMYGGYSAKDLRALLDEIGLEGLSSHVRTPDIPGQLEYAKELGLKYLIDPLATINTYEEAVEWAKKFNEVGKLCKDAGIQFGYHNHRNEFLEGKDGYLLETLIKNTDPSLVCFQLDVGWTACAGANPVEFIKKYADRFKLIHVKECNHVAGAEPIPDFGKFPKDDQGRPQIPPEVIQKILAELKWNCKAGEGIIDWVAVRDAATSAEGFIIEREFDYAGDIYKCVEEDCNYLKAL